MPDWSKAACTMQSLTALILLFHKVMQVSWLTECTNETKKGFAHDECKRWAVLCSRQHPAEGAGSSYWRSSVGLVRAWSHCLQTEYSVQAVVRWSRSWQMPVQVISSKSCLLSVGTRAEPLWDEAVEDGLFLLLFPFPVLWFLCASVCLLTLF